MAEKLTDKDKWMHLGVCLGAAIVSPALAVGLALGKEYGDAKASANHWCWLDLTADAVGIVAGAAVHYIIL